MELTFPRGRSRSVAAGTHATSISAAPVRYCRSMKRAFSLLIPLAFLLAGCGDGNSQTGPSTSTGFEQLTANLDEAPSATLTKSEAMATLSALTGEESEAAVESLAENVCQIYEEQYNPATDPGVPSAQVAEFIASDPEFASDSGIAGLDPAGFSANEMKILLVRSTEIACPKWTEEAFVYARHAR